MGDVAIRRTEAPAHLRDHVRGPQPPAALARLQLERHHGVSRAALAHALWPNVWPATWASALRTVVSRVRSHLAEALGKPDEDDLLVARGGRYFLRLPEDTVVDVELAESQIRGAWDAVDKLSSAARQLATAGTDRLRNPFLPECDCEWVTAQRTRLTELLVIGLEVASQAACAGSDAAAALTNAIEAVAQAPLRETRIAASWPRTPRPGIGRGAPRRSTAPTHAGRRARSRPGR